MKQFNQLHGKVAAVFLLAVLILTPLPLSGWGANGHRVVGKIAADHLSEKTKRAIQAILGPESLARAATWPDDIRSDKSWDHAKPWHFISIDAGEDFNTMPRDPKWDVIEAMERFEKVLRDPNAKKQEKVEALRFYVHFVGDVHQPLHVGRRDDRGGNSIRLKWFRRNSNLHSVWDSGMIDQEKLSFTELSAFIDHPTQPQIDAWQESSYENWVEEARTLREKIYAESNNFQSDDDKDLSFAYSYKNIDRVREQLLKGGVRLAGKLNSIFDH